MRNLISLVLLLGVLSSCDCGGGNNTEALGLIEVDAKSLDFGSSCPKPTDTKYEVAFPTKNVVLKNTGLATSYLNAFAVEAAFAEIFVVDTTKVPQTLSAGEEVEIPVTFKPTTSGTVVAKLHVAGDRADGADTFDITLLGEGKNFDPVPKYSVSCQSPNTNSPSIDGCAAATPGIRFAATAAGGFVDVPVTIKNGGCPTLTVQNIKVTTTSSDDDLEGFALADGQAATLSVPGGNASPGVINVRFLPKGAGMFYEGTLTYETNDPDTVEATVTISLKGEGTAASLNLDKSLCDFSKLTGPCNGQITIHNSGGNELTVSKVSLKNANPMFVIENADAFAGQVVAPTQSLSTPVRITYVPSAQTSATSPLSDMLVVESSAGSASCELRGGSPAVLKTTPSDNLDFNADTALPLDHAAHYQQLTLENVLTYNQQLDLTLADLALTDPRNAYTVVSSGTLPVDCPDAEVFAADTVVKPGESFTACIEFQSDDIGGIFNASLNVLSNDPAWPAPNGKPIVLKAVSSCEGKPTAVIEVHEQGTSSTCPCTTQACPATASCSVELPDLPPIQGSVDITGAESFEAIFTNDADGNCVEDSRDHTMAFYEWTLVAPADGSASILPTGKTTSPVTTLTYTMAGQHLLKLTVYDANGKTGQTTYTVTVLSAP